MLCLCVFFEKCNFTLFCEYLPILFLFPKIKKFGLSINYLGNNFFVYFYCYTNSLYNYFYSSIRKKWCIFLNSMFECYKSRVISFFYLLSSFKFLTTEPSAQVITSLKIHGVIFLFKFLRRVYLNLMIHPYEWYISGCYSEQAWITQALVRTR